MANKNLTAAKKAKNDEFYTQMSDIEKELMHYKKHFEGKTIFCNCDDPTWSNFWRYFHLNFGHFKLKKLIATHYDPNKPTYMMTYEGGNDADFNIGTIIPLQQNGDFRSPECVELLKEADIVVTNPPFSLFREYVAQLIEYEKKFVIIGNMNAVTYKEIFPLIKDNKLWYGVSIHSGDREFGIPETYEARSISYRVDDAGKRFVRVNGVRWFTNLDHSQRHEPIDLIEHYSPDRYPRYDNYDAINVDKTLDIPCDYEPCWYKCPHAESCAYARSEGKTNEALCEQACNGEMGVPISYLDKHCPDQMEIVGADYELAQPIALDNSKVGKDRFYLPTNGGGREDSMPESLSARRKCNGIMGVPISFLDKYCPEQFRTLQLCASHGVKPKGIENESGCINGKWCYARILVRRMP